MYPVICKYLGHPINVRVFTEYPKQYRYHNYLTRQIKQGDLVVAIRDNIGPYAEYEALILPFEDLVFGDTPINAVYRWKAQRVTYLFSYVTKEQLETLDGVRLDIEENNRKNGKVLTTPIDAA